MKHKDLTSALRTVVDVDGNEFLITDEIGRGGQGVVYSTDDPNLAIKQPITRDGQIDRSRDLVALFENIRHLPIPDHLHITSPLAILKSEPGYVMQHMSGRVPIERFCFSPYDEYRQTGGARSRLLMLASAAATLSRLHAAGLVYGDISHNNIYVDEDDPSSTWLIDPDNLRFEVAGRGSSVYTEDYVAPEVYLKEDGCRPTSDVWSFAVLAYRMLIGITPFEGEAAEDSWDAVPGEDSTTRICSGRLPYVDDPEDDSNRAVKDGVIQGLPREWVLTPDLREIFMTMFCEGRRTPWKRPSMLEMAKSLQSAADKCVVCKACGQSHYLGEFTACPWCDAPVERYCVARGGAGRILVLQGAANWRYTLPERLFGAYNPATYFKTEYEAQIDLSTQTVTPVRGTKSFPVGLTFEFLGGHNGV